MSHRRRMPLFGFRLALIAHLALSGIGAVHMHHVDYRQGAEQQIVITSATPSPDACLICAWLSVPPAAWPLHIDFDTNRVAITVSGIAAFACPRRCIALPQPRAPPSLSALSISS